MICPLGSRMSAMSGLGQKEKVSPGVNLVCTTPDSRHRFQPRRYTGLAARQRHCSRRRNNSFLPLVPHLRCSLKGERSKSEMFAVIFALTRALRFAVAPPKLNVMISQEVNRTSINHFPLNSCLSRPEHNHSSDDRHIQYAGQCSRYWAWRTGSDRVRVSPICRD
jgi:hypothetical protein